MTVTLRDYDALNTHKILPIHTNFFVETKINETLPRLKQVHTHIFYGDSRPSGKRYIDVIVHSLCLAGS